MTDLAEDYSLRSSDLKSDLVVASKAHHAVHLEMVATVQSMEYLSENNFFIKPTR